MALFPQHELKTITREESGWTVYSYRGAMIRSYGVHTIFLMPEHPYHGIKSGSVELMQLFVDHWLDHGNLPPGYLMPAKTRTP